MALLKIIYIFCIFHFVHAYLDIVTPDHQRLFDQQLYEDVLNPEVCEEQIAYMLNNNTLLLATFLDAGIRTPKGILQGNLADFGNYYQCLGINHVTEGSTIEGKYCSISVPLRQNITLPSLPSLPDFPDLNITLPEWFPEFNSQKLSYKRLSQSGFERVSDESAFSGASFHLAVCVPKTCSSTQFLDTLSGLADIGLEYEERYCRLPNDKKWVPADYVAIAIFSFLGLLVCLSTTYDVYSTFVLKKDPKRLNKLCLSFSAFTNTQRLVTYKPVPGTIECLDGIRSLAMMWVIIGHTYVNQISYPLANPMDVGEWITSFKSIWITLGPITVDTFFMLGGLLLVYTTAGKLTRTKLLKGLHLFYLNRLLRMFPVLAAFVLLQASLLSKMADGPYWYLVINMTEQCRTTWWATLLHIQNWVNPASMCLPHSWYLAIDVQVYILSPLVLFWVLGKKKSVAWMALLGALLAVLAGASVYNFNMDFGSWPAQPSRGPEDSQRYLHYYYVNTLTRASPFFVGMIYGYLLHLNRGKDVVVSTLSAYTLWCCTIVIFMGITYLTYMIMQADWDNQTADNALNSFKRPAWALAVGWLVFACEHGYGGPVNYMLSLRCWKVLSRLSYAMYIVHYQLIFLVNSTALAPNFFSVSGSLFKFIADFGLAVFVAFILTILVDAPCSILIKHFMGGAKRPQPKVVEEIKRESVIVPNGTTNSIENAVNEEPASKAHL